MFKIMMITLLFPTTVFAQANFTHLFTFGDSMLDDNNYVVNPLAFGKPIGLSIFDKAAKPGSNYHNWAVGGTTSWQIRDSIDNYVFNLNLGWTSPATFIVLDGGANDPRYWFPRYNINYMLNNQSWFAQQTINYMVDAFWTLRNRLPNAKIVVCTLPDMKTFQLGYTAQQIQFLTGYQNQVNFTLRNAAGVANTLVLDIEAIMKSAPPMAGPIQTIPLPGYVFDGSTGYPGLSSDGVHFSSVGNRVTVNELILDVNAAFGDTIPLYSAIELQAAASGQP